MIIIQLLIIFFLFVFFVFIFICTEQMCKDQRGKRELFDTVTHGVLKSVSLCTVVIISPSSPSPPPSFIE